MRRRQTEITAAIAALCAAVAACIGDAGAQTLAKPDRTAPLRYYGGPKSPMWAGQPTSASDSSRKLDARARASPPADK
jgi:hypothetical protein